MEDALAATVGAFQAHLVRVVEERKRLRDTFGASLPGPSAVPGAGAAGSAAPGASPGAGKSPGTRAGAPRALDAWGDPPSRSSDPEELRAELERTRRYAARLQRKREEAVRGALESENAAARAKEERDEMAREERARADAAEQDLDSAVEKFRVLRAEVARLREDAENLRKVNRALSRELYGGGGGSHAENIHKPPSTPSRGDLRREFESGGDESVSAANAFLRDSGVAAAAMEGVGALEGSAARLGARWPENAAGDGSRAAEEAEEAEEVFPETEGDASEPVRRDDFFGAEETRGETTLRGEGSLPPVPSDAGADSEALGGSVAARARAFHPAAPQGHPSASQAMASAAKQAKEATSAAAAAMAASAAASASSLRFAESRRVAARGDAFSHFPGPRMQKGSEWRPVAGALTSSGTVHVRSVAVLRQTHPGGTFGPPRRLFGDENARGAARSEERARNSRNSRQKSRETEPVFASDDAFSGKEPDWFLDARFAYDEHVAEARAATAARLEAAEAREAARLRGNPGARLPARLRPREDAPTAEDVDKAVKRFVKIFAENGAVVRLTRQAPFKYVLEQAGVPARDASGAFGARAARKMLMLKLERSRLVVHRGGASRGAGAAANAPAADLVEEIADFAAPAPRRRVGVAPLSSTTPSSAEVSSPGAAAARDRDPAPGLGKDKAWLASARRSGAASAPKAARVSHGAYNVASDMTFMPAPDAPTPTPPRPGGVPGEVPDVGRTFESSAERRKLERAFESSSGSSGGASAPSRVIPTGPRPFLRDDAPGAPPVRAGAPAPTRAEEQKAKPKPALPPPPAAPRPVAPKPAPAAPKPAAPAPAKPAVSAAAPAYVPRPKVTAPAADDDWDLP